MSFAGLQGGSFHKPPGWVDLKKPPGETSQTVVLKGKVDWLGILTGTSFFYSPNLVWGAIALAA